VTSVEGKIIERVTRSPTHIVCWTSAAKNGSIVSDDTVQTGKFNDLIE